MRDHEQNDAARDAGWLLHRVRSTLQRLGRLVTEPCNKARSMKNVVKLEHYYYPWELEKAIA